MFTCIATTDTEYGPAIMSAAISAQAFDRRQFGVAVDRYSAMALTIEDIVRISIAGMSHPINLGGEMFWKGPPADNPSTYVKLLKGRSEINRLLGQPWGKDGKRLQFSSIIEILQGARNEKMTKMIDALKQQKDKIDLDIDGPSPGKSAASSKAGNPRRRTKPLCDNETWKSLPEIISIDAPEFVIND